MSTLTPPEETGLRAVVAEDETLIRLDLVEVLTGAGYRVVAEAGDGRAAVEAVREHRPDIVVMDVKMPVMDGIALALTAARDFPELKILLMTGFAHQRERASGLEAIVHDVVTKPFSIADIRTAVADALAARKAQ